jgi:hypothetical protein
MKKGVKKFPKPLNRHTSVKMSHETVTNQPFQTPRSESPPRLERIETCQVSV